MKPLRARILGLAALALVGSPLLLVGCAERKMLSECEDATGAEKYAKCATACGLIKDGDAKSKACNAMEDAMTNICMAKDAKPKVWQDCDTECKANVLTGDFSPRFKAACKKLREQHGLD